MKKTFAIGLLFVHLLNFAGYSFIYTCLILQAEAKILRNIDGGAYDKSEVRILKMPLHLPYYNGSNEFERIGGEVEINGTHYTYIERKVSKDTLYLVCLLNKEKTTLSKLKIDFVKEAATLPGDSKKGTNSSAKKTVGGNEYPHNVLDYSFTALNSLSCAAKLSLLPELPSGALSAPYSPPDLG